MFSKLAFLAAASFAVFVAALPQPGGIAGSCNAGTVQCCNTLESANSEAVHKKAEAMGILSQIPISGALGINCTPISVLALNGQQCSQQTACCSGNNFSGGLVIGCSPMNVNV